MNPISASHVYIGYTGRVPAIFSIYARCVLPRKPMTDNDRSNERSAEVADTEPEQDSGKGGAR